MGQLGQPRDVAVDPATGDVWVADSWNQRFCRYASDGTHEGCWGGRGNLPPYGIKYPRGIAFDPVNRRVWVANNAGGTIYVYDDQANFLFQVGNEDNRRNSVPGMFEKPFAIGFGNGYAYVTDVGSTYEGNTVKVKILDATTGAEVGVIPARNSKSVAVDSATGLVYVADAGANQQKIYVYGPTGGTALRSFGGKGTANGKFTGLWGVTVANGVVYATDEAQSRVQAFSTPTARSSASGAAPAPAPTSCATPRASRTTPREGVRRRRHQRPDRGVRPGDGEAGVPVLAADAHHHLPGQQQRDRRTADRVRAGDRQPVARDRRGLGARQQHGSLVGPGHRHLDRHPDLGLRALPRHPDRRAMVVDVRRTAVRPDVPLRGPVP